MELYIVIKSVTFECENDTDVVLLTADLEKAKAAMVDTYEDEMSCNFIEEDPEAENFDKSDTCMDCWEEGRASENRVTVFIKKQKVE